MKKIIPFLLFIIFSGCAVLKLRVPLNGSERDIPMFGKNAAHTFIDSSSFTFPLQQTWEYDISAGFGYASPIIIDSVLFMGTLQGEVHAVNAITGKKIAYIKMFSPVQASLAVSKNRLFVGTESGKENFFSYDLMNGEIFWSKNIDGVVASPVIWNDRIIVGGLDGKLYNLSLLYGEKKWEYDLKAPIRSTPAVWNNCIIAANTKGDIVSLLVETGEVQWRRSTHNAIIAGLTVYDGRIIIASRDSTVRMLNVENGTEIIRYNAGNTIVATPSVDQEVMYVSSLEGTVTAVSIVTGNELWKFKAKSAINTTPLILKNEIIVSSLDTYLYVLNRSTGSVVWSVKIGERIKTTPLVWNNRLFITAEDRTIRCFESIQ